MPCTALTRDNPAARQFPLSHANRLGVITVLVLASGCDGRNAVAQSAAAHPPLSSYETATTRAIPVSVNLLVDQFGYRPEDAKVAVIRSPRQGYDSNRPFTPGKTYLVRSAADGSEVMSGTPSPWKNGATQPSSGDQGWWLDFSTVTAPGRYFVYDVERKVRSPAFEIDARVYDKVLRAATRSYFYQRSGLAKKTPQAEACWADGAAYLGKDQDTEARDITDPANDRKRRDVSGGWFDAGDTNKYVTFAVSAVHQLLTAYQIHPGVFTDDFDIPESGNGVPDLVDEVRWETAWLKKMQYPDGAVALKVGTTVIENASPPSADRTPRFYVPACTSSTIAAAGMFAHAAYVYGSFASLSAEAADLKARAVRAWSNYQSIGSKQTDCDTGVVRAGDADRNADEQSALAVVAAVYLFAATGEQGYHDYVKANFKQPYMRPYRDSGWSRYDSHEGEALLFYTSLANSDPAVRDVIRKDKRNDIAWNPDIYGFNDNDLYRSFMHDGQYHWGSNQPRANYGNSNLDALDYDLAVDRAANLRLRAQEILHYFHGVNPFAMVYLSNMASYGATSSATEVFHAWYRTGSKWGSSSRGACGPAPGFIPGGPNAEPSVRLSPPGGQPLQKSYRDWNGDPDSGDPQQSWEITEPGIYYQAAYIKLLAAFAR